MFRRNRWRLRGRRDRRIHLRGSTRGNWAGMTLAAGSVAVLAGVVPVEVGRAGVDLVVRAEAVVGGGGGGCLGGGGGGGVAAGVDSEGAGISATSIPTSRMARSSGMAET